MGGEEGVLLLDDGLPVVPILGLFVAHRVNILLLQDVLALQGQPSVVIPPIAGVQVVLLEVMLIRVADGALVGLVQLGLLARGGGAGEEGGREVRRLDLTGHGVT